MHEMQTIVILMIAMSVRRSVSLSVTWLYLAARAVCAGHSVQPLPNRVGLLFVILSAVGLVVTSQ